jgi:hypothetical protein
VLPLERADAAERVAHHDPDPAAVPLLRVEPGVGDGLPRGDERQVDVAVEPPRGAPAQQPVGVET